MLLQTGPPVPIALEVIDVYTVLIQIPFVQLCILCQAVFSINLFLMSLPQISARYRLLQSQSPYNLRLYGAFGSILHVDTFQMRQYTVVHYCTVFVSKLQFDSGLHVFHMWMLSHYATIDINNLKK